jgi:hypothetical protein
LDGKRPPQGFHNRLPARLTVGNLIELIFHAGGEFNLERFSEMFEQKIAHHTTQFCGLQLALGFDNVIALV